MATNIDLPADVELVRTTPRFDQNSVPAGLLAAHQVAEGVWGRLVVHGGAVTFVFEDEPDEPVEVRAEGHVVIPPARPHHLELSGPVMFEVEFYRPRTGA